MRASFIFGLTLAALPLTACNKSEPAPEATPGAVTQAAQPAAKAEAPPKPIVEDNTFKLSLIAQPNYTAGAAATASVVLEARGGYHVNQDYPIKVELKGAPAIKLPKSSLGKADLAELAEHKARFEVPFTAEQGAHQLTADVDFAVCTAETCVPDQRTVALTLDVK